MANVEVEKKTVVKGRRHGLAREDYSKHDAFKLLSHTHKPLNQVPIERALWGAKYLPEGEKPSGTDGLYLPVYYDCGQFKRQGKRPYVRLSDELLGYFVYHVGLMPTSAELLTTYEKDMVVLRVSATDPEHSSGFTWSYRTCSFLPSELTKLIEEGEKS